MAQTLGKLIDELATIRDARKAAKSEYDDLGKQYAELEAKIMSMLDDQGAAFAGSTTYRATLTSTEIPNVEDWAQFEAYILENDALYLLEKRPSTKAWRELRESGEEVPGTVSFTKRGLSLRSAKN